MRETIENHSTFYFLSVPMNQRVIVRAGSPGTEFRTDGLWLPCPGNPGGPGRRTTAPKVSGLTHRTVKARG